MGDGDAVLHYLAEGKGIRGEAAGFFDILCHSFQRSCFQLRNIGQKTRNSIICQKIMDLTVNFENFSSFYLIKIKGVILSLENRRGGENEGNHH